MSEIEKFLEQNKEKEIQTGIRIANLEAEVTNLKSEFHDCVNELCLQCGNYREEHNCACDDCRWLKPRRGW